MGAIDLVVQVGAPPSVASGLQRIGRAGHQVGAVSRGVVFPTFRGELVPAAVTARADAHGTLEALSVPQNALDVLAQQIVAMVAVEDWTVDELAAVVRRAARFSRLGDATLRAVLDMLAGRYPSEDFAELRPRLVWDRVTDVLTGPPRRAAARGHERRHHPGPRPVRRVPGERGDDERRPGRRRAHRRPRARRQARGRARRGDGLRVARRRHVHARLEHVAHRRDHARPRARHARARRPRAAAVLEGRLPRSPGRAGARDGRLGAPDRGAARRRGTRRGRGCGPRRVGGRQPAHVRRRAAGRDRRGPLRHDARARAVPRRAG